MSQRYRAVAIDGPAASGKSTVAKHLAASLGLVMVNSGAMYRAVTWQLLQDGVDPLDQPAVIKALDEMEILCGMEEGLSTIAVNGKMLTSELRSSEVNNNVSKVASIPEVRDCLVAMQRARSQDGEADAVAARDAQDSQRKVSPLKISEGAIVIDSSDLTIESAVAAARDALSKLGWKD